MSGISARHYRRVETGQSGVALDKALLLLSRTRQQPGAAALLVKTCFLVFLQEKTETNLAVLPLP
ncbi:MAG: hypothetical protein LIO46_05225 [Clostridiales bacterium]|nr:hypothetical protein [Clostridiales bacterium]